MKSLTLPAFIIVAFIVLFVVIDNKKLIHKNDIQSVQMENNSIDEVSSQTLESESKLLSSHGTAVVEKTTSATVEEQKKKG